MSFSQSGSTITQSGTDTDLSGLSGTTGVTTQTVGNLTIYIIASNNLAITGTCTMDPPTEMIVLTSTTTANQLYVNGGTFNVGSPVTPSYGTALDDIYPQHTAIVCAKDGPGCCSGGAINVNATGTLNAYGAIFNINAVSVWANGSTIVFRDVILYSQDDDANTRIRCQEGTNIDIDGLTMYGIQFDWLVTETFGTFENFKPLNRGMPIENATGTAGTRAWRVFPDNTYATDASMNNWQGAHDVTITLAERGSRCLIVPDSTSSSTAHGGRIYHEFYVLCLDTDNAPIQYVKCLCEDFNNSLRIETTTGPTNIDGDVDQSIEYTTGSTGLTSMFSLMIAMYYRTNSVSDLATPDGQERVDYRGKPHTVEVAITASSGVSATLTSSDSSLPLMTEGDRFILQGSTSNDDQTWKVTNTGTAASVNADRLNGNSTNESEQTLSMSVLGEDAYDVILFSYLYLPYSFNNATMHGLVANTLTATLLLDPNITETNSATVDAYTTIDNAAEFYDAAKFYIYDNFAGETAVLVVKEGTLIDAGTLDVTMDSGATAAFDLTGTEITIKPTDAFTGGIRSTGTISLTAAEDQTDMTIDGDLHIDIGANATLDFDNVTVTGDVYNDSASYTLQINSTNGSSLTAGDPGTGNGQTNIVATCPIKVTVKDIDSGSVIEGARVLIAADTGGDLPFEDTVTITRVTTTATVAHTAHGMVDGESINIKGAVQPEYNGTHVITYISANSYSYTVSGTPTTPATGTILATAEIVNELTNAAGEVNETHRYTSDQPVLGRVRKATI